MTNAEVGITIDADLTAAKQNVLDNVETHNVDFVRLQLTDITGQSRT